MKTCSKCSVEKPLTEYWNSKARKSGKCPQCISCMREHKSRQEITPAERTRRYKLKSKFGITVEQYELMAEKQNHRCAICRCEKPSNRKHWDIDHNHVTGQVRGLLCNPCNQGLGMFKDDTDKMKSAINYLNG